MRFNLLLCSATMMAVASQGVAQENLTMGMVLEPPHLDPTAGAAAAIDEVVYANIFEGLTKIDQNGAVIPGLASSWQVSDDELTYTFDLVEGASFHDGSSFEAEDVVYSFERAMAEDSTNAQKGLFADIASVEASSDHQVIITLSKPNGGFLFNLGWGDAVIVDPASAETNKSQPVGTGPFRFKDRVEGDRIEIERFEDYWGEQPALSQATFKFISDPAAATAALLANDVDAFANFPAPEALIQFENNPEYKVVIGTTEGETILAMNNGAEPLNDLKVRQAIAHAVDREAVINGAMFGFGTPIGSHFAPHHPAYQDFSDLYAYDPAKAKELLIEAGYEDGLELTLKLPPPSYARRGGEIIASQLGEVGIKAEIIPLEWAQWLEEVFRNKAYDLTIVSHTEPLDIGIYARDDYYFAYENPTFNEVMAQLDATSDPQERNRLLGEAQAVIANDSVNGFLFQLAKHGVWKSGLEGLWENSPVQANDLTAVRWAD